MELKAKSGTRKAVGHQKGQGVRAALAVALARLKKGEMTETATSMEDGLSLRPLTLRPGGAGPGKNPFAGFGRGAGASLAKKVGKQEA